MGTVTLLLADVEGSTRLWEVDRPGITAALVRLDALLDDLVARFRGVRPVEQGEGDSFVVAFTRASDAVGCAVALQQADLTPVALRIGLHTGDAQLRDEGNYVGPVPNRCARLRDLGHGGQILLSQATYDLVVDHLDDGLWFEDLGDHRMRGLDRPERVHQLCHRDLGSEFPPLRSLDVVAHNLPVQLTSFVGRDVELAELQALVEEVRLVTLTGAGGAGKTRLALHLAAELLPRFGDGVWQVDLAPVNDHDAVAVTTARALGVRDEPSWSTTEAIARHVGNRRVLVVLDNCEHLIGASAALAEALLRACPSLTLVATSREPLGVAGEVAWRVPSLSLPADESRADGEAVELFVDRARRARADFALTDENAPAVGEICRRLDGIPLAIELAAARVRAFSPERIAAGLHDRFRLLTGGARSAVQRQQTLRASVEWSHRLLTGPEQTVFRRIAVFAGSFDLDAAMVVGAGEGIEAHHVLDLLALLVDKSLVVTDGERYWLLETVRQFALDELTAAAEGDAARRRHRDHYTAFAMSEGMAAIGATDDASAVVRLERELDNLRGALGWSLDVDEPNPALAIAAACITLWLTRGRLLEGRGWLDASLAASPGATSIERILALSASAMVEGWMLSPAGVDRGDEAVALAHELGDPVLLAMALLAPLSYLTFVEPDRCPARARDAIAAAKAAELPTLVQTGLHSLGTSLLLIGDLPAARAATEDAVAIGATPGMERFARALLALVACNQGDLEDSASVLERCAVDAEAEGELTNIAFFLGWRAQALALLGRYEEAIELADRYLSALSDTGARVHVWGDVVSVLVAVAAGDLARATRHLDAERPAEVPFGYEATLVTLRSEVELALGNLPAARQLAARAVAGCRTAAGRDTLARALTHSARIAAEDGEVGRAEELVQESLAISVAIGAKVAIADGLEELASLRADAVSARLFGAASALRERVGSVRFRIHQGRYEAAIASTRVALGDDAFEQAWAAGAALSLEEAVAYAQRGHGPRKRPASGWGSLTPMEVDVARLVGDGLANREIADKLFISPRTVQAHLTHIYAKLGLTSRVQLAREAIARS